MIGAGVFAWAAEALIASCLLMLLVMVARGPVRRAFGPGAAYALWLLPAARLLLPPLPAIWPASVAAPIAAANSGFTVFIVEPLGLARAAPEPVGPSALAVAGALWALGAMGFILWHIVAHNRFCRRLLAGAQHWSAGPVRVIATGAATGPLAFGIWRKYIAFPSDFDARYDAEERALALAHELTHHARGDLIANWAGLVVLALHWFNPVAWRAFRAFRADQEMACDARVLADQGRNCAHAYGRAIVKSAHGGAVSAACHLHNVSDLKGRLQMLSKAKLSRMQRLGGGVAIGAALVVGLGVTASGGQAAETLRGKVGTAIGIDLPAPALAVPALPALATGNGQAAAPPAPPAAPADASAASPPQAPAQIERRIVLIDGDDRTARALADGKDDASSVPTRIILRSKNGRLLSDDRRGDPTKLGKGDRAILVHIPEVSHIDCPETAGDKGSPIIEDGKGGKRRIIICKNRFPDISSADCPDAADDKQGPVVQDDKGGKRRIIICSNRISKLASEGMTLAFKSGNIERGAYRSALQGLRSSRARMADNKSLSGDARTQALKAIDEAIAELEQDLAGVN